MGLRELVRRVYLPGSHALVTIARTRAGRRMVATALDEDEIVELLDSPDPDIRDAALQILAEMVGE